MEVMQQADTPWFWRVKSQTVDIMDHVIYFPPNWARGEISEKVQIPYVDIVCIGILVQ